VLDAWLAYVLVVYVVALSILFGASISELDDAHLVQIALETGTA